MKRVLLYTVILLGAIRCSPNNVDVDSSLETFFKEHKVEGCFALLNNNTGKFTVYNMDRYRDSAYAPGNSFDLVTALVGLQTGVINNDSSVMKSTTDSSAKSPSMFAAFRTSSTPYFAEVARRIGKDTMQFWLDSLGYGTKKIKTGIDSFWQNNSLKVKPDEVLGLVKRLYFNSLPFHRRNQEMVKNAMLMENRTDYKLSYKIAGSHRENGNEIGWLVGYVEENNHPYFFILNTEAPAGTNLNETSLEMTKQILSHLGFLKGRK